jgi:hypothetical protein
MDNPVDHPLDLGFVNYVQHPTDKNYVVFRYTDVQRANDFRAGLIEAKITFEEGEGEMRTKTAFLFGVHKRDYKKAQALNYKVEGKNKKFIIPNKYIRSFVVIFGLSVLTLAIVGHCKSNGLHP